MKQSAADANDEAECTFMRIVFRLSSLSGYLWGAATEIEFISLFTKIKLFQIETSDRVFEM